MAITATIADCAWCNARFVVDRSAEPDRPEPVAGYAIVPIGEAPPRRILARLAELGLVACLVAWDVIATGSPVISAILVGAAIGVGALDGRWPSDYRRRLSSGAPPGGSGSS